MTTRFFCDLCDEELLPGEPERLVIMDGPFRWEVIQTKNGVSNTGHAHHHCILRIFAQRLEPSEQHYMAQRMHERSREAGK